MEIVLIAPTPPDVAAFGIRTLSAYLKSRGKQVRSIFLPGGVGQYMYKKGYRYQYNPAILDQVIELATGADLIGISFMSNYLDRAQHLSKSLKAAMDVPLVMGGIHPTVMPEQTLEFADIVCVGEGEEALLELVERMENGEDYQDVRNLWFRGEGGQIIKNSMRPLIQDLDSIPFFDFSLDNQFIFNNVTEKIEPMSFELLEKSFPLEPHVEGTFYDSYKRTLSYKTMTTRGCPHHCTFCAENTLKELYGSERYLRKRSIGNIIDELLLVKEKMPFVESIFLFDDTFLVRTNSEIQEFSRAYKEKIGLPFHIQASPTTTTVEKMDALVDAGLSFVEMGIQSTSETSKELYKRSVSEKRILVSAEIIAKYVGKINPPCYHVILDNPWESASDVRETLLTILKLSPPFWLKRSSLICFPGTALYTKAKKDEIITNEEDEWNHIYGKHLHTPEGRYINFLMYLAGFSRLPRFIVKFMAAPLFMKIFERRAFNTCFSWLNRCGEYLIKISKGVRALFTGDFLRIQRYFIRHRTKTN